MIFTIRFRGDNCPLREAVINRLPEKVGHNWRKSDDGRLLVADYGKNNHSTIELGGYDDSDANAVIDTTTVPDVKRKYSNNEDHRGRRVLYLSPTVGLHSGEPVEEFAKRAAGEFSRSLMKQINRMANEPKKQPVTV